MKIGVLWDLDGTLLDTLADLADAVNYALTQKGYSVRTYQEIRAFVGNGVLNLIRRAVPEGTDEQSVQETLDLFRGYYADHTMVKTCPFAGVVEQLNAVAEKYPVAVVSNKLDSAVVPMCAHYFPGVYALGEKEGLPRKPAPDMVRYAMTRLGIDSCIYVGDSDVDIMTARNAGVPCLSVTWGFRDEEELKATGATRFCRETSLLSATIDEMVKEFF